MTDYNIDFKDHKVQFPNRFKQVQVSPGVVDLVPTWIENPSEVIEEGTPVNAELFDKLRANVTRRSETFAATAGQTVFNLTKAYLVDQGRIDVYISGIKQRSGVDFTETSPTSFTLTVGVEAGTIVEAVYFSASQALSEDLIEQVQAAEAATIAASEAAQAAEDATIGALSANLNRLEPVDTFTALQALPNPQERDTRMVRATGKVYRYDGSQWLLIEEIDATAINEVDSRLTSQLAERALKTEVNSLATAKADKSYVDTNITTLDKKINTQASGAPKGVYASLSDLQTAFPSGNTNIYLVTSDGKWYYWSGSVWTAGGIYQSTASDLLPASNRVVNGNFANGTTKWTVNYGTAAIVNNVLTLTGSGTNATPHIIQNVGVRDITKKYYSKISVRAITDGIQELQFFNSVATKVTSPVLNQWYDLDVITTPPTTNTYIAAYLKTADAATSLDKKIEVKYVLEIDLTQTFGAGNEPTIEEMRQFLSPYPNNWFEGTSSFFNGKQVFNDVKQLKAKKVTEDDLGDQSVTTKKIANDAVTLNQVNFSENTKNLFNGVYEKYWLYGALDKPYLVRDDNRRTAVIPIKPNENYTISVYGDKNAFRIATSVNLPTFNADGVFFPNNFLHYNDVGRQFTFTNNANDRYLYVMVSNNSHEPLMQVEKGRVVTEYVPFKVLRKSSLPKSENKETNLLPKFTNTELVSNTAGARFIDYFDGKMWGYRFDGGFYYSTDEGRNWTVHTITWDHTNWGWVQRLVPTSDDEVIAVSEKHIRKSSGWKTGTVTWSANKVTPNTNCVFPIFGFDGDGTKFIVTEYANGSSNWQYSRFVHISLDSGNTFTQVFDSLARHGAELNNITHLHAACYDKWADRFYFSEGHSPAGGLFYSEDNGATWHQGKGHRDGVLYSQGIVDKAGDTNGPTVIIATDEGLVMGSDNQNNGIFGLVRKENPDEEVVEWIYRTHYERKGVQMFAQRGWRDPESGTVYITFRSEWDDVPPIIVAATPTKAKLAYEYPTLPVRGASDRFMAIAKISPNRIVANSEFAGVPHTFRAELQYPNTEIRNLIRIELKNLGLI